MAAAFVGAPLLLDAVRLASPAANHGLETARILAQAVAEDLELQAAALLVEALRSRRVAADEIERVYGTRVRRTAEEVIAGPAFVRIESRRRLADVARLSRDARLVSHAANIATLRDPPARWREDDRAVLLTWMKKVADAVRGLDDRLDDLFDEAWARAQDPLPQPRPRPPEAVADESPRLLRLAEYLERLRAGLRGMDELANVSLRFARTKAADVAPRVRSRRNPIPAKSRLAGTRRTDNELLCRLAKPGVRRLLLTPGRRGSVVVGIDAIEPFVLPRALGRLLQILASKPAAPDGFAGFVAPDELAEALARASGHPFTRGAVNTFIGKLRDRLEACAVNPMYVETHPDGGFRFRLRRSAGDCR
jgi:hypothetical protein